MDMKNLKISLLHGLLLFVTFFPHTNKAEMVLDESFGTGGIVRLPETRTFTTFMQTGGEIILLTKRFATSLYDLMRCNRDGSVDTLFSFPLKKNIIFFDPHSEESFIIRGSSPTMEADSFVIRSDITGTIDSSFNEILLFYSKIYTMAIQPNGKIVIAGVKVPPRGPKVPLFTRYNRDGTVDNSFNPSEINLPGPIDFLTLQSDGKILVAINHPGRLPVLIRYNSNGTLDENFGTNGLYYGPCVGDILSVRLQSTNKIIVETLFPDPAAPNPDFPAVFHSLARLNSNGSEDDDFHSVDLGFSLHSPFAIQQNDTIITIPDMEGLMAAYNSNGTPDTTFGPNHTNTLQLPPDIEKSSDILVEPLTHNIIIRGMRYNLGREETILLRYRPLTFEETEERRLAALAAQEAAQFSDDLDALLNIDTLETCGICFEEANLHHLNMTLCEHLFHPACMTRWKTSGHTAANTCPICRTSLPLQ
jgi:uncharacterized delta-60 repeat protein